MDKQARTLIIAALLSCSFGCASLHIEPADSAGVKIAKGVMRIPVGVLTLGRSEMYHQRERVMRSWIGHHEADLLMAWGPPAAVLDAGGGDYILVYIEDRMHVTSGRSVTSSSATASAQVYGNKVYGQAQGQSRTTYTPAVVQQWTVFRQFRVRPTGEIVAYSWRGL